MKQLQNYINIFYVHAYDPRKIFTYLKKKLLHQNVPLQCSERKTKIVGLVYYTPRDGTLKHVVNVVKFVHLFFKNTSGFCEIRVFCFSCSFSQTYISSHITL